MTSSFLPMPSGVHLLGESMGFLQLLLRLRVYSALFSSSHTSVVVAFLTDQKLWK